MQKKGATLKKKDKFIRTENLIEKIKVELIIFANSLTNSVVFFILLFVCCSF
jgi:hypothetical protein